MCACEQMKGGAAAVQLRGHTVDSNYSVCFHLMRPDGTCIDFSYYKCLATLFPRWAATTKRPVRHIPTPPSPLSVPTRKLHICMHRWPGLAMLAACGMAITRATVMGAVHQLPMPHVVAVPYNPIYHQTITSQQLLRVVHCMHACRAATSHATEAGVLVAGAGLQAGALAGLHADK